MNDLSSPPPGAPMSGPPLETAVFERISAIAYREAGLSIAPGKAAMVRTRLARRLRALKLASFEAYAELVEGNNGLAERREMISALTTNVSHFFREDHHFDRFKAEVWPELRQRLEAGGRVRIWSAGCSNGQEPYSIAMSILESGPLPAKADLRILASDIDPKVVAFGRRGIYQDRMMTGLPDPMRDRYFNEVKDNRGHFEASAALKDLVAFRELNLLHSWPMRGTFDIVFCRNVVIYFDTRTQDTLWQKFAKVMSPGAWLFLGHSERISDSCAPLFANKGVTAYQRVGDSTRPQPAHGAAAS